MTYAMLHGLGDCAPERHCGCLTMTPERIVAETISTPSAAPSTPWPARPSGRRWVIKARLTTPWREVPDADA